MSQIEQDKLLDHDADGIQEFDNDLPRWWLYGFYFTIVMGILYMFYYHVYTGADWNVLWYGPRGQVAEYNAEIALAKAANAAAPEKAAIAYVAKTDASALKRGEEIFAGNGNLCYTCHRADLGGVVGPNLTDDLWLHGCSVEEIANSIRHGYPEKGMLAYGNNNKLSDDDLLNVVSYIISRRGSNPASPKPVDPTREKDCR